MQTPMPNIAIIISLISLIKIAMELNVSEEINGLFTSPVYMSIDEVLNDGK